MTTSLDDIRDRIARQKELLPDMYGAIDFDRRPERFTDAPDAETAIRSEFAALRPLLLADRDRVATIEAYTMLGDLVADAYAALMPECGFRRLVEMLDQACADGIDSVENPPAELVAFVADMTRVPDWLDMALVEEGARIERNMAAHLMPFLIRGAFVATFMNTYAALPMAITGSLSTRTAGRRMKETASFFACTTLPGALERHGVGFRAAAKVRLMHSMVRFNILRRDDWDSTVYGIPIPQSDQMPAGLIPTMLLAMRVLEQGRDHFTPDEQAQVEFARYRCYLLGLPEDLLQATPRAIVDVLATRQATLRKAYDDTTCGALVRATMQAYTEPDRTRISRLRDHMERSTAKAFFIKVALAGSQERAAAMGMQLTVADKLRAATTFAYAACLHFSFGMLLRLPITRSAADVSLVRKIGRYLERLGHAEFTTDAATYHG
ncbi:oxygenase MpaB family protein [Nocardia sp. NPDC055053]